MTVVTLQQFKDFLREMTTDLDDPFELALEAATAEVNHFLGFDADAEFGSSGIPFDIQMAGIHLGSIYADVGDPATNEARRATAQKLLIPYRRNTGIGAAA